MTLTFISPLALTTSKFVSASNTLICSRTSRTHFARRCHSHEISVACASQPKETQVPDEEEKLDEAAMRAADIHEVLQGLRDFKNRIIDDATKLAKKVRAPKKQLEAALAAHPDIIKIDGHIAELEEELKVLGDR